MLSSFQIETFLEVAVQSLKALGFTSNSTSYDGLSQQSKDILREKLRLITYLFCFFLIWLNYIFSSFLTEDE